jgi:hypothetical protein
VQIKFEPLKIKFESVFFWKYGLSSRYEIEHTFPKIPCINTQKVVLLLLSNLHTRMPRNRKEILMEQDYNKLKEFYIEAIVKMLKRCDDISLLDLIKTLLEKCI